MSDGRTILFPFHVELGSFRSSQLQYEVAVNHE